MAIEPGTLIGPYEVLDLLGAGGMGEVYRARDARLDRQVAVKVLPPARREDADLLRRFEQEARAVGALNHPNIMAVHDVGAHEGAPYIVSEYLEGETLRSRLRSGPLPVRKAVDLAVQVARALAAAHDKGIVHRDLKPENLFITRDGRVKVLDFGVAKLATPAPGATAIDLRGGAAPTAAEGAHTSPGAIVGTVSYMSPEQVRGLPVDHRSDIFSLGAILYEMLSGVRAFDGESHVDVGYAIVHDDPPEIHRTGRDVPLALQRMVSRCLEKQPAERFQSMLDLAFDLETLSGLADSGAGQAVSPPHRRIGGRAILLAVAASLAVATAFVVGRHGLSAAGGGGTSAGSALPAPAVGGAPELPAYRKVTFRRGPVQAARFAPDGSSVIYDAAWDGSPSALYSTLLGSPESRVLMDKVHLLAVSGAGEAAILVRGRDRPFAVSGTLARLPLAGGAPRELLEDVQFADFGPDGESLAVARVVDKKNRLEYPVGRVLVETSGWIGNPRVSPGGDLVAFVDHDLMLDDGGYVAVAGGDGGPRRLTGRFMSIQGLAWSPDRREVWFTAAGKGLLRELRAVDLEGHERLLARAPGTLTLHDVAPSGRALLAVDQGRLGIRVRDAADPRERELSCFDWSLLTDLSADGKKILVLESGDGAGDEYGLYLRGTDGSPAVRVGTGSVPAVLSPDGRRLAVVDHLRHAVHIVPTGPGEAREIPVTDRMIGFALAWLPDGKRLLLDLITDSTQLQPFVLSLDGGEPKPIGPPGMHVTGSRSVSPDGRWYIGVLERKFFLVPMDGGEPVPLTALEYPNVPLGWTADGKWLYVQEERAEPREIVVARVHVKTGRKQPVRRIEMGDLTGLMKLDSVYLTADARTFAYAYLYRTSQVFVVDNLK